MLQKLANTCSVSTKYSIYCIFTARGYANRGIRRRRVSVYVSVCLCVCHTLVLYQNG